ncbi:hypothetical protein ACIQXF_09425 [Lysinibacillus sp. NPDC097231]|uniref:hypothetical protein n=1 Tax=Lysinibacillus sp. NPDC097231 TaxID=3364142 RepID=UPI003827D689
MAAPSLVGPTGLLGSTGATGPISQAFFYANIEGQTIASGAAVSMESLQYFGIDFNGTDTFIITGAGLYSLDVVLNFAVGTPAQSYFGVSINGGALVAPSSNANTVGQISVIRVNLQSVGETIRIVNGSPNSVTIAETTGVIGSAGHISLYRFADEAM